MSKKRIPFNEHSFFSFQDRDTEDDHSAPSLLAMSPAQSVILDDEIYRDQAEDCMSEINRGAVYGQFLATQLF